MLSLCMSLGSFMYKWKPFNRTPIFTRFEEHPAYFQLAPQELLKAKKNAIPFSVDLQYLEEQYINKTIRIFQDKTLNDEVRFVLVTAYTSLQLIHERYHSTLEHLQYIEKLNSAEFITTTDFTVLFPQF